MLSFHLYINGILIIVPIDNWCHPRWRRSILGICRSKGLNYVLTFWLTPFLKSFEDMSFFSNSFFGLDLSDWRLESSKSFLSSNSTLWLWDYFYILVIILHYLELLFQQLLSWAWGLSLYYYYLLHYLELLFQQPLSWAWGGLQCRCWLRRPTGSLDIVVKMPK